MSENQDGQRLKNFIETAKERLKEVDEAGKDYTRLEEFFDSLWEAKIALDYATDLAISKGWLKKLREK